MTRPTWFVFFLVFTLTLYDECISDVELTVSPPYGTWILDRPYKLTCKAKGNGDVDPELKWFTLGSFRRPEQPVPESKYLANESDNNTKSVIVKSGDAQYACVSEKFKLQKSGSIVGEEKRVRRRIDFSDCPSEINASINDTVEFKCYVNNAHNNYKTLFTWTKKDRPDKALLSNDKYLVNGYNLKIKNAKKADEGIYTLRAMVIPWSSPRLALDAEFGSVITKDFKLSVEYSIELEILRKNPKFPIGQMKTLRCEAKTGLENPELEWYGPDGPLNLVDNDYIMDYEKMEGEREFNYKVLYLIFNPVREGQAGIYMCRAKKVIDGRLLRDNESKVEVKTYKPLEFEDCNSIQYGFVSNSPVPQVIHCKVSAEHETEVTWIIIDESESEAKATPIDNDENYEISSQGLVIKNLQDSEITPTKRFQIIASMPSTGETIFKDIYIRKNQIPKDEVVAQNLTFKGCYKEIKTRKNRLSLLIWSLKEYRLSMCVDFCRNILPKGVAAPFRFIGTDPMYCYCYNNIDRKNRRNHRYRVDRNSCAASKRIEIPRPVYQFENNTMSYSPKSIDLTYIDFWKID